VEFRTYSLSPLGFILQPLKFTYSDALTALCRITVKLKERNPLIVNMLGYQSCSKQLRNVETTQECWFGKTLRVQQTQKGKVLSFIEFKEFRQKDLGGGRVDRVEEATSHFIFPHHIPDCSQPLNLESPAVSRLPKFYFTYHHYPMNNNPLSPSEKVSPAPTCLNSEDSFRVFSDAHDFETQI
jgi:hypothetical protein